MQKKIVIILLAMSGLLAALITIPIILFTINITRIYSQNEHLISGRTTDSNRRDKGNRSADPSITRNSELPLIYI